MQVSQVVQSNAASAEESAAASEELAEQAGRLKETVSVFVTKESQRLTRAFAPAQVETPAAFLEKEPLKLTLDEFGKY